MKTPEYQEGKLKAEGVVFEEDAEKPMGKLLQMPTSVS